MSRIICLKFGKVSFICGVKREKSPEDSNAKMRKRSGGLGACSLTPGSGLQSSLKAAFFRSRIRVFNILVFKHQWWEAVRVFSIKKGVMLFAVFEQET